MKIKVTNLKSIIVEIISFLVIILFVYASLSKILEFENFQAQLGQSPLLSAYTGFISYAVLTSEIVLALLLALPKTRTFALLSSFTLMFLFTVYIIIILNYSSYIPCSCGGILEKLGWKEHLVFNSIFTVLLIIAILLDTTDKIDALLILSMIASLASGLLIALNIYSNKAMHQENPFIRRFIQGAATKSGETNIPSNTQYFAGNNGNTIFLADTNAPLHINTYDSILKTHQHFKIQLERENFPFQSVQIRVFPPYFYLMDGTVPVIFKGFLTEWKANLLMHDNNYYFSRADIVSPNKIVFRAQERKSLNNILGTFTFKDSLQVDYAPTLLQKQIDGFFDTDGIMSYDIQKQKFIYTYFYRNQFIVTNNNLELIYRGNTIDTTTVAKLKVAYIEETKQRKIASPPTTVNQLTATSGNLLFVNSKIIGRYEARDMWEEASVIDVYNSNNNTYLSSFYIYNVNQSKPQSIMVVGNNFYAIIGNKLHRYHLSNHIVKTNTK